MGKMRRGVLWGLFPPAGAVASVRAGQRQDTERIVQAIEGTQPKSAADIPVRQGGTQSALSEYAAHKAAKKARKKLR